MSRTVDDDGVCGSPTLDSDINQLLSVRVHPVNKSLTHIIMCVIQDSCYCVVKKKKYITLSFLAYIS